MGTFNLPNAVFMPELDDKSNLSVSDKSQSLPPAKAQNNAESNESSNDGDEKGPRKNLPGDAWMVPVNLTQDIGMIHFLAGFDKEGM